MRRLFLDVGGAKFPNISPRHHLIIKEPNGSMSAPLILEAFPESKLIFLVPATAATWWPPSSMLRRRGAGTGTTGSRLPSRRRLARRKRRLALILLGRRVRRTVGQETTSTT